MKLIDWIRKRKRATLPSGDQTYFQQIISQSKIYGADYREPPLHSFDFPKDTWLQRKLNCGK